MWIYIFKQGFIVFIQNSKEYVSQMCLLYIWPCTISSCLSIFLKKIIQFRPMHGKRCNVAKRALKRHAFQNVCQQIAGKNKQIINKQTHLSFRYRTKHAIWEKNTTLTV